MHSSPASTLLGGLVGFLIGGIVVDAAESATRVLISVGTFGCLMGAGAAALLERDVARWSAICGVAGIAVGVAVLLADAIVGV